ncbi:hypothetical protein, partial [Paraburkholderia atlantica]|uniref:hypothetical protein n=1 Tax=Paraburkholderia atlantica TaxID=2654982 RepID=UPI001D0F88CA
MLRVGARPGARALGDDHATAGPKDGLGRFATGSVGRACGARKTRILPCGAPDAGKAGNSSGQWGGIG